MISEKITVQNPLLKYAAEIGWDYVSSADALSLRKGETGMLFNDILREKLIKLNPGFTTKDNADEIIHRIESERNSIEGNAEILAWLRGEKTIYDHKEKRNRNVTVINYDRIDNNIFQVTDEWQFTNGRETNRADIMFLINGIPVAIVETKSAKKKDGLQEALTQIREYHHETPEMLTTQQVFDITHLIDFYYGVTWNLDRKNIFRWKVGRAFLPDHIQPGEPAHLEKDTYENRVKTFFEHKRFLTMLKEWILFYYKDDELQKTVLRQHQTKAIGKILERCSDKDRKTGLVWHTQGSGKTFTMITAARLILQQKEIFGKATVILMIDRNELEGQLTGWVERILGEMQTHDIKIEHANTKKKLNKLLESDFRGLVISMIHKFDGVPKNINTRDNIFILIDEAHRTIGGDLGNYLIGALPKATLIGFTGTPIDKTAYGKGTFKIFGKEDDKGYLDKYSIRESIEDETTVPLKYALAPNEIRVPREQLEKEFLSLAEAEGISDVDDLNRILDHALRLKTFLKSKDRIDKVAAFVAKHYCENVEPMGYKAFLVGVDREACALYKDALDKLLPPEYSMPVYSPAQHDSEKYPVVYRHQINEDNEKKVRKLFPKAGTVPKIFIVTDKLLTGFDAPILYCMYLDKPMRDHVLLQAIARVNRPYEAEVGQTDYNQMGMPPLHEKRVSRKPCGLVVDFVGIFEKLEKALAFDSDMVSGVIEGLDVLLERFKHLMEKDARRYLELCLGNMDDKSVERAIDYFPDKESRDEFLKLYMQIQTLYEIISPSPELRNHLDDFSRMSSLYQIIRNAFTKQTILYGDVAGKTETLIREKASAYGLDKVLPGVKIDEHTIDAIKKARTSENAKIINLVNSIRKTVDAEDADSPFLRPIGDRAEAILEAYDDRQITSEVTLKRMCLAANEIVESKRLKNELCFDSLTFSLYWILKGEGIQEPEKNAKVVKNLFERFPNFKDNSSEMRQLKAELYKFLFPVAGKDKMVQIAEKMINSI